VFLCDSETTLPAYSCSPARILLQYGRDFEKVSAKVSSKTKDANGKKTKEQCRHYHFRQCKRIKQFLQDSGAPDDATDDKNVNELRCDVSPMKLLSTPEEC
jgi:hypothetical protein